MGGGGKGGEGRGRAGSALGVFCGGSRFAYMLVECSAGFSGGGQSKGAQLDSRCFT